MSTQTVSTDLVRHVRSVVEGVQREYATGPAQQPTGAGSAWIAILRRLDPARPGDDPSAWGLILDRMPSTLAGREGRDGAFVPSRAESAAHAAICLYAIHQQSHGDPVHVRDRRPGLAFGTLARARAMGDQQYSPSVVAHIHAASTASTIERRLYELRTLITLLRGERAPRITLDYGLLARDLYRLDDPMRASSVRLAWGRDLHARQTAEPTPSHTPGDE